MTIHAAGADRHVCTHSRGRLGTTIASVTYANVLVQLGTLADRAIIDRMTRGLDGAMRDGLNPDTPLSFDTAGRTPHLTEAMLQLFNKHSFFGLILLFSDRATPLSATAACAVGLREAV